MGRMRFHARVILSSLARTGALVSYGQVLIKANEVMTTHNKLAELYRQKITEHWNFYYHTDRWVWVVIRAALRVLPMLVEAAPEIAKEFGAPFFVEEEKAFLPSKDFLRFTFASFRACQCAAAPAYNYWKESEFPANTHRNAYEKALIGTAALAASDAALATVQVSESAFEAASLAGEASVDGRIGYLADAAIDTYLDAVVDALALAFKAADANADLIDHHIQEDIAISKTQTRRETIPLWSESHPMPYTFASHWLQMQTVLLELDPGFQYWIDWYEARLRGDPIVWEDIREQIQLKNEQLKQEPAVINAYLLSLARKAAVRH